MKWPEDYINKVICGDCLEVMKGIPDGVVDMVVTDPVWPNTKVELIGSDDPFGLWSRAMKQIARILSRLVVHLSCTTDPRFLREVPRSMPFVRMCYLEYIPPRYRGNILDDADVAYCFGDGSLPEGRRLLAGKKVHVSSGGRMPGNTHPCYRALAHTNFLIGNFTKQSWLVLDPFAGSGATLVAAKAGARNFIGIEINPEYCEIAEQRLAQEELFGSIVAVG